MVYVTNCIYWDLLQNMKKGALAHANFLANEVFALHAELRGVSSDSAELQYMKDVLLLDGYGCEFYIARVVECHCKVLLCSMLGWMLYVYVHSNGIQFPDQSGLFILVRLLLG